MESVARFLIHMLIKVWEVLVEVTVMRDQLHLFRYHFWQVLPGAHISITKWP
jgi:hypothetical protein